MPEEVFRIENERNKRKKENQVGTEFGQGLDTNDMH